MRKALVIISVLFISSCATKHWVHVSGNNQNAAYASSQCKNFAVINYPTYICRNLTYCMPDETYLVISSISRHNAAFNQCMNQNGYRLINKN
jgi:hypothetical protein